MTQLDYTVPGLLFPAVSFFMLAATQRFMGAASVIRQLHDRYLVQADPLLLAQIDNLRFRVTLTRSMQTLGALALLLNTATIFALYLELGTAARSLFGTSLVFLLLSIAISVWEIHISVRAIDLQSSELKRTPAG